MIKEKHVFSFQADKEVADKIGELVGVCATNDCRVSDGLIMRTLVLSATGDLNFIGLVRARLDVERAARLALHSENAGKEAVSGGTKRKKARRR